MVDPRPDPPVGKEGPRRDDGEALAAMQRGGTLEIRRAIFCRSKKAGASATMLPRSSQHEDELTMSYLDRDGVSIYYEQHGAGPAVLLSHGYSASARMWQGQMDALADSYHLIAWDMRGHDRSDSPDDPVALFARGHHRRHGRGARRLRRRVARSSRACRWAASCRWRFISRIPRAPRR